MITVFKFFKENQLNLKECHLQEIGLRANQIYQTIYKRQPRRKPELQSILQYDKKSNSWNWIKYKFNVCIYPDSFRPILMTCVKDFEREHKLSLSHQRKERPKKSTSNTYGSKPYIKKTFQDLRQREEKKEA